MNFWNFTKDENGERVLRLEGPIDSEDVWGDEVTPKAFREELNSGDGNITVWINSPGGSVLAASEIYTMLCDYKGKVTVKIDALAASAASVVAMAGDRVLMSPTSMLLIHDPMTMATGNAQDMEKVIETLNTVKEAILNAYVRKTGLSRAKVAKLMSDETWMDARKAVELGFADEIMFAPEGGNIIMTFRKKILTGAFTAIFVLAFSLTAFASAVRVGVLSKLNTEEGDFTGFIRTEGLWKGLNNHGGDDIIVFYDSILSMLLSMNAGELEEIELPGIVGAYVMSSRPDYKISCTVKTQPEYLAFGFLKGKGEGLRDKFNEALSAIKSDGTLDDMKKRYLRTDGETEAAAFEKFAGAETIRVAVTEDLPPIDAVQHDVPAGVILSEPYYDWDTFIHITQKNKAAFNDD